MHSPSPAPCHARRSVTFHLNENEPGERHNTDQAVCVRVWMRPRCPVFLDALQIAGRRGGLVPIQPAIQDIRELFAAPMACKTPAKHDPPLRTGGGPTSTTLPVRAISWGSTPTAIANP